MLLKIASILTALAALLGTGGAIAYRLSEAGKGVQTFSLLLLPLLAIPGFLAATLLPKVSDTLAYLIVFSLVGAMIVLAGITLMSIGPIAILVALLMALAAALACRAIPGLVRPGLLVLTLSSLLSCILLISFSTSVGTKMVHVPPTPGTTETLSEFNYIDSFRVQLAGDKPEMATVGETFMISLRPWWFKLPKTGSLARVDFEEGSGYGGWVVTHRSESEVVIGFDRSFIDLRLSLLLEPDGAGWAITATTIARYNDWRGKLYFLPIRYGHQIVLADTVRRMVLLLEEMG